MAKKSKQLSGGARLIASGKTSVSLGLHPDEVKAIDDARRLTPRTAFITSAALSVARMEMAARENDRAFDLADVEKMVIDKIRGK